LNLNAAIEKARKENKLIFLNLGANTHTHWVLNEKDILPRKDVGDALKKYICVRQYINEVPADCFDGEPTDEQREHAAKATEELVAQKFAGAWRPFYAIFKPAKETEFEKIAELPTRRIEDPAAFVQFLNKPFAGK